MVRKYPEIEEFVKGKKRARSSKNSILATKVVIKTVSLLSL